MIVVKVSRVLLEDMPYLFGTIKQGLIEMMDERLGNVWVKLVASQFGAHNLTFLDFHSCGASEFFGMKEPVSSMCWIVDLECVFQTSFFLDCLKTIFHTCFMRDGARDWQEEVSHALGAMDLEAINWKNFVTRFKDDFVPAIEVLQLGREFQYLQETTDTMENITSRFREKALLVPQYDRDEEMKKMRYQDMLKENIRMFVIISSCQSLKEMIDRVLEREIELELQKKQKASQVQTVMVLTKQSKTSNSPPRTQSGQSRCGKYGRSHKGPSRARGGGFFKCGHTKHIKKDFKKGTLICFHYNQVGYKNADCSVLYGGAVRVPAPSTLRITDGRQVKEEDLMLKSQAFQLMAREAKSMPYVVPGMSSIYFFCFVVMLMFFMV